MDTRTIGDLTILTPDLDPRDLDPIDEPPVDELREALVDGADWPGLQLDAADIRLSHLIRANLTQAVWRGTTIYACRFEQVDLSGARLTEATIERCEFIACRLTGLQLTESVLKNVLFENCRLDYATLTQVRTTGSTALLGCNLDHATLTRCALPQVAINRCQMSEVELDDCDLHGVDLRGNNLSTLVGIASLRGSVVTAHQIGELAATLARELTLTVREPTDAAGSV